jgi:hypothetical protein
MVSGQNCATVLASLTKLLTGLIAFRLRFFGANAVGP